MPTTPTYALPYPALSDAPNVPADIQGLAEAADSALSTLETDIQGIDTQLDSLEYGPWQAMSLQNGWVARPGYHVPSYREIPGDRVEIIGGLIDGITTSLTVIANLPVGFRPEADTPLPLLANNGVMYGLFIRTTGDVEIFRPSGVSFNAIYLTGSFPRAV